MTIEMSHEEYEAEITRRTNQWYDEESRRIEESKRQYERRDARADKIDAIVRQVFGDRIKVKTSFFSNDGTFYLKRGLFRKEKLAVITPYNPNILYSDELKVFSQDSSRDDQFRQVAERLEQELGEEVTFVRAKEGRK